MKDTRLKGEFPPSPKTERGRASCVSASKDGTKMIYCCQRNVIIRDIQCEDDANTLVYRGHNAEVTVAKFSPNGYWVASGDCTGKVRVWAFDNPEHILKIEINAFAGSILDLAWDPESKRICAVGDGREQ